MRYLKRLSRKNGDDAISPVVGVMLMLVVTIIIAAVVSGFSGDLVGSKDKTPSISLDVQIKNTGLYASSVFQAKVVSVSDPIPTSKLKLVTHWTNSTGGTGGATVTGGNNVFGWTWKSGSSFNGAAPWGAGPGVAALNTGVPTSPEQQFGNYTLLGGTTMYAYPAGQSGGYINSPGTSGYGVVTQGTYSGWSYTPGSAVDGMQAVLGNNWETLRTGEVVNVKLIYVPTGTTVFDHDVVVG